MRRPGRQALLDILRASDRPLTLDEIAERMWHVRPLNWSDSINTAVHFLRKNGHRIERSRVMWMRPRRG